MIRKMARQDPAGRLSPCAPSLPAMPLFTVSKSIRIAAPVQQVYDLVRDFKSWPLWSPWLIAEPSAKLGYSDDGRSYTWDGSITGSGEMEITGGDPGRKVGDARASPGEVARSGPHRVQRLRPAERPPEHCCRFRSGSPIRAHGLRQPACPLPTNHRVAVPCPEGTTGDSPGQAARSPGMGAQPDRRAESAGWGG